MMSLRAKICETIYSHPGITRVALSKLVYGPLAYPALIDAICRQLVREGRVLRSGLGGKSEPFRYTWILGGQDDACVAARETAQINHDVLRLKRRA